MSHKESNRRKVPSYRQTHQFATMGNNGRLKTTTRHLAALDFLSTISMTNEKQIKSEGRSVLANMHGIKLNNDKDDHLQAPIQIPGDKPPDGPGRMLPGVYAPTLTLDPELKYRMQLYEQRNELKRWESQVLLGSLGSQANGNGTSGLGSGVQPPIPPILATRLFCSRARAYPVSVFSVIKYDAGEEKAKLETLLSGDTHGFEVFNVQIRDWRGSSYQNKLSDEESKFSSEFNIFDDTEMRYSSSHRHSVRGAIQTGPVISSIILYANEKDLRESVNEQFMDKYPNLPPSLNISEVCDLTISLAKGCIKLNIEIATAALAYICFERLCLQSIITKSNRNLAMAVSLLLSYKFNECYLLEEQTLKLHALFEFMDREWDVSKKEAMQAEFGAYTLLNFSLLVPHGELMVIYHRLLKYLRLSSSRYIAGFNYNY